MILKIGDPMTAATPLSAPASAARPRVLFLNRSYWPCNEATGQLLTELCEDVATDFDIRVIAGQPNQNPDGVDFRKLGSQRRRGVQIQRVFNSRFNKSSLPGRATNLLSYLFTASFAALFGKRPHMVVVETDPPLLSFLGAAMKFFHRCQLIVYLQDIYPDLAVSLGKIPDGFAVRLLRRMLFAIYRRADRVVVLSRDMRKLLMDSGVPAEKIVCIPNWVDTRKLVPTKRDNAFRKRHDLGEKFVVMYSGNLGMAQRLNDLILAAENLNDRADIEFLFVGDGVSRKPLEKLVAEKKLGNVRFLGYQPKSELSQSLSAADLHVVSLDPTIAQCLMPSKLYGILASGTAVLTIAPEETELARVVADQGLGMVVGPGNPESTAAAIRWCADHRLEVDAMGARARIVAAEQYDRATITNQFGRVLTGVLTERN